LVGWVGCIYLGAIFFDILLALLERLCVSHINEYDAASPFFGKGHGDGVAEAAGAAGYESYAWREWAGACCHYVVTNGVWLHKGEEGEETVKLGLLIANSIFGHIPSVAQDGARCK
jgi:hypothetical protein